jgi:hypothetical protein
MPILLCSHVLHTLIHGLLADITIHSRAGFIACLLQLRVCVLKVVSKQEVPVVTRGRRVDVARAFNGIITLSAQQVILSRKPDGRASLTCYFSPLNNVSKVEVVPEGVPVVLSLCCTYVPKSIEVVACCSLLFCEGLFGIF